MGGPSQWVYLPESIETFKQPSNHVAACPSGRPCSSKLTSRSNVLVSKSGCTSIRRPPGSTTASPQLGSYCFGDFLAANSTGTQRPTEETGLCLLFQRRFFR